MRSRDGNSTLLFSVFSVVLFNSIALSASEYLVSYRYVVKDATLFNETLYVSKAMKKCSGVPKQEIILENPDKKTLKELLSTANLEFIEYVHKLGLHVAHSEINQNFYNSSTTTLTLATTCFKVEFNEDFAKIAPLK